MSDFLELRCPSCERTNLVDRAEVGADGAWRHCQSCNARIFVSAEGEASGGSYAPQAEEPELGGGLGFQLRMPTGKVERLSHESFEHGVQSGRILPWDLASEDGQEFAPVSEHPELRALFLPSDFVAKVASRCVNHPDAAPAGTCRRCGRSYCSACVASLIKLQPRLCPACNGAIADPDPRLKERPPWERLQEIARLPVDGDAWKVTLGIGILLWAASLSPFTWPLSLLALAVFVDVAARASRGEARVALPSNLKKLAEQTAPIAALTVALALPLLLFAWLVSPATSVLLQAPWSILILLYAPAAVALLLLGLPPSRAVDPKTVLRAVAALKEHYLLLLLGLVAVGVAVVFLQTIVSFLPWVDGLLGGIALGYGMLLQAYLLGWTVYMQRERLLAAV